MLEIEKDEQEEYSNDTFLYIKRFILNFPLFGL